MLRAAALCDIGTPAQAPRAGTNEFQFDRSMVNFSKSGKFGFRR
jgi:hypothetical protein